MQISERYGLVYVVTKLGLLVRAAAQLLPLRRAYNSAKLVLRAANTRSLFLVVERSVSAVQPLAWAHWAAGPHGPCHSAPSQRVPARMLMRCPCDQCVDKSL